MNLFAAVPLPYRLLALALLAVALVGFGWIKGAAHATEALEAAAVKQSLTAARIRNRQAEATAQVVTQYVDRVKVVREAGATIVKEVPVYVTQDADADCRINRGFVRLHDAAAAGRIPEPAGNSDAAPAGIALSAAASTVADNYGRCRENAEQLIALQEWVERMRQFGAAE